ncbi:MAG: sarcosine oxidase subunit gamma family protein [Bauldia sp.]
MADVATVTTLPPAARFSVRGSGPAVSALGIAFGVELPREACRAAGNGKHAALWLGPDEWLLLAPDEEAEELGRTLASGLHGEAASIVDISDRQVAITLSGAKAAEAIGAFNALDLELDAFPVGMCTRTLFGKAEIVLWRTAPDAFHIEVWRSFAPYVLACLEEALREYA